MENQYFTAVLIDTVSIQQYIFSSNKLKENIGASYIIERLLYRDVMLEVLRKQYSKTPHAFREKWQEDSFNVKSTIEPAVKCEIGYIGGGNALVLFKDQEHSTMFIKSYTLELMKKFPGLRTAFGVIHDFDPTEKGFQESRERLNRALIRNKSLQAVNVIPFKPGIVEDCHLSNEAQETDFRAEMSISVMSAGKLNAAVTSQENIIREKYKNELQENYVFTDELDKLGQPEDKGYIAVVHVDGNGMGKKFMECKDLQELRELSKNVSDLADNAMKQLIEYIIYIFEKGILKRENGFELKKYKVDENANSNEKQWEKDKRKVLPIRPIIVGGDDITFVCDGRLGVHLAEKLIEFMTKIPVGEETISACAGVAVVHTKYPFYRAYSLSEELTSQAKKRSREIPLSSWLSFIISSGGFSGTLEQVQEKMFSTANGNLYNGPYRLDTSTDSLKQLKEGIKQLTTGNSKWPRSKIMAFRDVLRRDKPDIDYFIADSKARKRKLPEYNGHQYHKKLWENNKTPYYDMIELMDFYPQDLL